MADAYGPEIKQAAKTLHIEGLNSAEIRQRLADCDAGLPFPVKPSERAIDNWRRAWKREGVRQGYAVRMGEEDAVENAIYRRLLGVYRYKLQQLEDLMVKGNSDLALAREIAILQTITDSARAKRQTMRKRAKGTALNSEEGAELRGESEDSILMRLAAEEEQHEKAQPGNEPTEGKKAEDRRDIRGGTSNTNHTSIN